MSVAYPRNASHDGAVASVVGGAGGREEATLDCSESAIRSVCECLELTALASLWAGLAMAWVET
jgi:hypothetical protein